ncbi:DUF1120 domain-containing protein [Enterobacter cloacae]|uniref:DUF1120 domain-containing protein n=1 Tax=Enterobacter cloacae TaxID=550 RepID=UPI0020052947|nr:DUF1120 domain-containing protein [Enterobacter cloacae]MCK7177137.1 DUF1120 domain-containing protein [Enterobacter cloacae]
MGKTLFALAIMAATTVPAFANSVDVKVTGTITPDACTATLANGGVFDYGLIKADTLATDRSTDLATISSKLNITCSAPTIVVLKATSSRPDTGKPEGYPVNYIAFAEVDGMKVGGYGIYVTAPILDGAVAQVTGQYGLDAAGWGALVDGTNLSSDSTQMTRFIGFNAGSNRTPQAFSTLSVDIGINSRINKASELDLSKDIKLDGLATIELVYF